MIITSNLAFELGTNIIYNGTPGTVIERVRKKAKPRSEVKNVRLTTNEITFVIRLCESKINKNNDKNLYWVNQSDISIVQGKFDPVTQRGYFDGVLVDILTRIGVKKRVHGEFENIPGIDLKSLNVPTFIIKKNDNKGSVQRVLCTDVELISENKKQASVNEHSSVSPKSATNNFLMTRINVIKTGYAPEKIGRITDIKPSTKPMPEVFSGDFSNLLCYRIRPNSW